MSKRKPKDHLVAFRLDAETFKKLVKESEDEDISISSLIRDAIRHRYNTPFQKGEVEDGSV